MVRRRWLWVAALALVPVGLWLLVSQDQEPVTCPEGRIWDEGAKRCLLPCELPGLECDPGELCDPGTGRCVPLDTMDGGIGYGGADAGVEQEEPPPVVARRGGAGGGGPVSAGRTADDPECKPGQWRGCGCPGGASGEQLCSLEGRWLPCDCASGKPQCDPGEQRRCRCARKWMGTARCGQDLRWEPCSCTVDRDGGEPVRCEQVVCPPHRTCDEEAGGCVPWPCGPDCKGTSRCVTNGGAVSCEPAPCLEDPFGGHNLAADVAQPIGEGTYSLAFCRSSEDWFAVFLKPGQALVVDVAFDPADGDLDLVVLHGAGRERVQVAGSIGWSDQANLLYNVPEDGGGRYEIGVYEVLPPGKEPVPMYYYMTVEILDHHGCTSDGDCRSGELCNRDERRCEPKDCRTNLGCPPLHRCDEATGRCVGQECEPDLFGGENSTPDDAVPIELGRRYDGLTICDGRQDWFLLELSDTGCLHAAAYFDMPRQDFSYDVDLALFGPGDPTRLALMAMRRGLPNEDLWFQVTRPGTYFLSTSQASHNVYSLEVTLTPGRCVVPCDRMEDCEGTHGLVCDLERHLCVPFRPEAP